MREPDLALALIGFGNVARRFLKLLDEVAERLDFTWRVVGIATRRHGSVIDPDGVDVRRAIATVEGGHSLNRLDDAPRERSGIDVIRHLTDASGPSMLLLVSPSEARVLVHFVDLALADSRLKGIRLQRYDDRLEMLAEVLGRWEARRVGFEAESVARTSNLCVPLASPCWLRGEEHLPQGAPSRLHSNDEPLSDEEKAKVASPEVTVPVGPEVMVVSGGVRSSGGGC